MSLKEFAVDSGATIAESKPEASDQFAVLDLAKIIASLTNPRQYFNEPRLAELAESIKASGVHQPVLVRPLPASRLQETFEGRRKGASLPEYELIAGERRFRASKLAGVATIPVMIRSLTDDQVLEVQLIENLQRDDLHPIEEAEGYERLAKATGISKEEIGAKVGKSRNYVYARLKLLDLTAKARKAFLDDKIDASRALVIARIPNAALQEKALQEATRTDWQGNVPSFREFTKWSQQNMMLKLSSATFKITDVSLVPDAGACKDCHKRTGAAPGLFEDVKGADVCIDPQCFNAKTQAHESALLAAAEATGRKVIEQREAKKLWQWEGGNIDGYVRLDRPDPRTRTSKMLKTVLGKDAPDPILLQNPHKPGELVEVLPKEKVSALLKEKGLITPQQASSTTRTVSDYEAKRNAVAKFEKTWRKRAIAAVAAKMKNGEDASGVSAAVARLVASEMLGGLRGDERQHICELLGLGKVADRSAIDDYLKSCSELQAEQALHLLLMQQDMLHLLDWHGGGIKAGASERIAAVAADFEIDLESIKSDVKSELTKSIKPAKKVTEQAPKPAKASGAKKSTAPPAARTTRAKKPSAVEVQGQIAEAFQELDQKNDQAPDGAELDEGAAPAAPLAPNPALQAWPFPKGAA